MATESGPTVKTPNRNPPTGGKYAGAGRDEPRVWKCRRFVGTPQAVELRSGQHPNRDGIDISIARHRRFAIGGMARDYASNFHATAPLSWLVVSGGRMQPPTDVRDRLHH
jgi:hypothetical protein